MTLAFIFSIVISLASTAEATPIDNDGSSSKPDSRLAVDFYGQQVNSKVAAHLENVGPREWARS
ncbi:hypothetical protein ACGE24_06505 [Corynebacterium kroppenstedtii]|uniref:hypothetical protein n=1 Tax=Corynebacterium sp. PCR 32 TaxID=3351342 RepID=UPI0030A17E86